MQTFVLMVISRRFHRGFVILCIFGCNYTLQIRLSLGYLRLEWIQDKSGTSSVSGDLIKIDILLASENIVLEKVKIEKVFYENKKITRTLNLAWDILLQGKGDSLDRHQLFRNVFFLIPMLKSLFKSNDFFLDRRIPSFSIILQSAALLIESEAAAESIKQMYLISEAMFQHLS